MYADNYLLTLPYQSLKDKELLPEHSGIYYVVDTEELVWYIGQAQNIKKRWQGKSHHRLYQLVSQKKKDFRIYYELIDTKNLDIKEKEAITKYSPNLNNSSVKTKKTRPSESLLRETIISLENYISVIGIESPRQNDIELQHLCLQHKQNWWILKKILGLNIIHLGIHWSKLLNFAGNIETAGGILNNILKTRKAYSQKWESFTPKNPYIPVYGCGRLLVNSFAIEIGIINFDSFNTYQGTLASEKISIFDADSVKLLNDQGIKNPFGLSLIQEKQSNPLIRRLAERIEPFTEDIIPVVFNEKLDRDTLTNQIEKVRQDYIRGKRGFNSRSKKG